MVVGGHQNGEDVSFDTAFVMLEIISWPSTGVATPLVLKAELLLCQVLGDLLLKAVERVAGVKGSGADDGVDLV